MTAAVTAGFTPVRLHIKEQPREFKRWGAEWTPTIIFLDPATRTERHRVEGFLPKEEFLAHLGLARGRFAYGRDRWTEAEREFQRVAESYPDTNAAAEAAYWAGVSRYKHSGDGQELKRTWGLLNQRYPDSIWTKKASVWAG